MHSDFKSPPWNEESEERPDDTETGSQAAGYSAMVSGRFQMLKCICEDSHRSFCALYQNRVGELGLDSAVSLEKLPPFSGLVVNGDKFHASSAWTSANTAFMCAANTIRYPVHFVNERYSLPDGIHYLADFKPAFLQTMPTTQDDLDALADAICSECLAVAEASTEATAAMKSLKVIRAGTRKSCRLTTAD